MKGLEPPHLAASDPKSDVSTNSTTSGNKVLAHYPFTFTDAPNPVKNLFWAAKVRF